MNSEHYQRLQEVFGEWAELEPRTRQEKLKTLEQSEPALAKDLVELFLLHDEENSFLQIPAAVRVLDDAPNLEDFDIYEEIGRGAASRVFHAKQLSLDREVALKFASVLNEEALLMAPLEHPGIVRVFSVIQKPPLSILCMELIRGPTLAKLLKGNDLTLERVAWMGKQLAKALSFAHERGVLHLDIKPANILLRPSGEPCLTDFNVAIRKTKESVVRGGTQDFMSPEQAAALRDLAQPRPIKIDERSDLYSLGIVLRKMLAAIKPDHSYVSQATYLHQLVEESSQEDPRKRPESAEIFAQRCQAVSDLARVQSFFPKTSVLSRWSMRHPVWALLLLACLPESLGSVVNITYNAIWIVETLTPAQKQCFETLVIVYNLLLYPMCIGVLVAMIVPLLQNPKTAVESSRLRRHVLKLPVYAGAICAIGWLPGAILFPWGMDILEGPVPKDIYLHFGISFVLSWLMALSYTVLYVKWFGLRFLYPRFWAQTTHVPEVARREFLKHLRYSPWIYTGLSGAPLMAAVLVVWFLMEPAAALGNWTGLKILITMLVFLGAFGVFFTVRAGHAVTRLRMLWTSS